MAIDDGLGDREIQSDFVLCILIEGIKDVLQVLLWQAPAGIADDNLHQGAHPAVGNAERFSRMEAFFAGTGQGDEAGIWPSRAGRVA